MSQSKDKAAELDIEGRGPEQRLKVFISYSRTDGEFVDRLVTVLEAHGLDVLIDRRDLPLLEEWQRELLSFIRQADAVVFIVSPASLKSKWCEWEVTQVAALNKRLAPVVAKPVAEIQLPDSIGKIHLLNFTESSQFEDEARKLVKALNTDLAWIKEHTRLGDRSRLWLERSRTDASLLRGSELQEAERWLLALPRESPPPTAEHREFIQESRRAEQARAQQEREQLDKTHRFQRRAGWALGGISILLIAAAMATLWQVRETNKKESTLFASRAAQWSDRGHCDQAMRFSVLALPPNGALPFLWVWSAEAEAQLFRSAWGCPLISRIALSHGGVSSAALAPDDRTLLVTGKDGTARLIDLATSQEIGQLGGHSEGIEWGAFSADGRRAVTAGWGGYAIVWELATKRQIAKLVGHSDTIFSAAFSPDGKTIVTASDDGTARIWDAETGKFLAVLADHKAGVTSASFSPDGALVVTSGKDNVALVWDAVSHRVLRTLKGHKGWVTWATFSPKGDRILTAGHDYTARVWNAHTAEEVLVLRGHTDALHAAAFSPDERIIATGSADTSVRLWDAKTGTEIDRFGGHAGAIWTVAFSADATRLISASEDRTLRISSVANIRKGRALFEVSSRLRGAQFNSEGTEIIGWTSDGVIRAWEVATGRQVRASSIPVNVRAMAPGGAVAATLNNRSGGQFIDLVDWTTGQTLASLPADASDVRDLQFSRDGSRLVAIQVDDTLRVWDANTGKAVSPLLRHEHVVGATLTPDAKRLLTFGRDKRALIWDVVQGKIEASAAVDHDQPISVAQYSPDGRLFVTGSADNSAWIVDAALNEPTFRLWHKFSVTSVDFSPTSKILATTGDKVYLWHTSSGTELAVLEAPSRYESVARFSPDGKTLLVWGNRSARIFDVGLLATKDGASLRQVVCSKLLAGAAEFTAEEMRDPMLGSSDTRAPCSRPGALSAAYWSRLARDILARATSRLMPVLQSQSADR